MIRKTNKKGGYTVITTVIFFLVITLAIISSIVVPTTNQVRSVAVSHKAKQGYVAADAVNGDALYRLNLGLDVEGTISLPFPDGILASAVITDTSNIKEIVSEGTDGTTVRFAKTVFSREETAGIDYAAQIGTGGLSLSGSSYIQGDVYSNGPVSGTGSTYITGSATVANADPAWLNQTNSYTDGTSPIAVIAGSVAAAQDVAQSFHVTDGTLPFTKIRLYMKKTGNPGNATIRIIPDSGGKPNRTGVLATATLNASTVTTSYTYITVPITGVSSLSAATTYWIVVDVPSTSASNYYTFAATNNTYANGMAKTGTWSTNNSQNTWNNASPANVDLYFDAFLGGAPNTLSGLDQYNRLRVGTGSTGEAWANQMSYLSIGSTAFCQTGTFLYKISGSVTNCDTSRSDPPQLPFAVSSTTIASWKNTITNEMNAITGGWTHSGNLTVNYLGTTTTSLRKVTGNLVLDCSSGPATFGDLHVTGNLTVQSSCVFTSNRLRVDGAMTVGGGGSATVGTMKVGGTLNVNAALSLKGPVWVVGDVLVNGSAPLRLASSMGTTDSYVIADGKIAVGGSATANGSGQSGSYLVLVTTTACGTGSSCAGGNAISISGASDSIVLVALDGTVYIEGSGGAKSVMAKKVILSGSAHINYETGLADIDLFDSSESETSVWSIEEWGEVAEQ